MTAPSEPPPPDGRPAGDPSGGNPPGASSPGGSPPGGTPPPGDVPRDGQSGDRSPREAAAPRLERPGESRLNRIQRRRQKIRDEIERNRRGDYRVPTWVLVAALLLLIGGWIALVLLFS